MISCYCLSLIARVKQLPEQSSWSKMSLHDRCWNLSSDRHQVVASGIGLARFRGVLLRRRGLMGTTEETRGSGKENIRRSFLYRLVFRFLGHWACLPTSKIKSVFRVQIFVIVGLKYSAFLCCIAVCLSQKNDWVWNKVMSPRDIITYQQRLTCCAGPGPRAYAMRQSHLESRSKFLELQGCASHRAAVT